MVKERTNPHLPTDDVRHSYVSGKDVAAEQERLARGQRIERGAELHKEWSDEQWKPRLRPLRRFRVGAWIGDITQTSEEDHRTLYTLTKEDNQVLADYLVHGGYNVHLECWELDHPQDDLNRGWALYGHASPTVTP